MMGLNLLGDGVSVKILLLSSTDAPIMIFAIFCLLIAYIKTRKSNWDNAQNVIHPKNNTVTLEYRDVLMQPKKRTILDENKIPFTNFSMSSVYYFFGIIFIFTLIFTVIFSEAL